MLPMQYDPFFGRSPFTSLQREINRVFGDFMKETPFDIEEADVTIAPRLDLTETQDGYRLEADLPGVGPGDLNVEMVGNTLTIRGEKTEERTGAGEKGAARVRERRWQRYERTIVLPESVDASRIEATLRNGVLVLTIPKSEAARPRQIEVKSGDGAGKPAKQIEGKAEEKKKVA